MLATLASCSDSSGPSGFNGTVSFTYSGATTGSFSASGGIPSGAPETEEWAVGFRSDEEQLVGATAIVPRSSTKHDFFFLQLPRLTVGSSTITDNCTAENCAAVVVDLNVDNTSGDSDFFCGLTQGTITITSISSTRVEGTFNGTGECITTAPNAVAFAITNGSFNVALVSDTGF
jgi:hypothetical protein